MKFILPHDRNKGFTLIELLVVIAIIGLLSSIVTASLSTARSKARDTKRVAETRSIEKALTLYSIDHKGLIPASSFNNMSEVPTVNGQVDCVSTGSGSNYENNIQLFNVLVSGKYLSQAPAPDPQAANGYCYVYITTDGQVYAEGTPSKNMIAGAVYEADGNSSVSRPIYLAAIVSGQASASAVFFFPSETRQTLTGGYRSAEGVSYGPIDGTLPNLNRNYTTGTTNNTAVITGDTGGSTGETSGGTSGGTSGDITVPPPGDTSGGTSGESSGGGSSGEIIIESSGDSSGQS